MLPAVDRTSLAVAVERLAERPRYFLLQEVIRLGESGQFTEAVERWKEWRRGSLDHIDGQSMKLLPRAVSALEQSGYEDPERRRIAGIVRWLFVRSEAMREQARFAARRLSDRGIVPIAMKGLALSTGYGVSLAKRPMLDADLVVEHSRYGDAERILVESGFRVLAKEPKAMRLRRITGDGDELPFDIDLHRHALAIDPGFLAERFQSTIPTAEPFRVLGPEGMLISSILHGLRSDGGGLMALDVRTIVEFPMYQERVLAYAAGRWLSLGLELGLKHALARSPGATSELLVLLARVSSNVVEALELRHVATGDRIGAEASRVLMALRAEHAGTIPFSDIALRSGRIHWDRRWLNEWR